jgi:hypothetical protein
MPGTGFQTAETEAKMPSICGRRLRTETHPDAKSPYSGATMRQARTEFEPWRLGGGDSRARPTTQSSNRSPTEPGTEIFDAETGLQNPAFCSPETDAETISSGQKPPITWGKCEDSPAKVGCDVRSRPCEKQGRQACEALSTLVCVR